MTRAVYLIGAPGTGKSTVMDNLLLDGWTVGDKERLTPKELFGHQLTKEFGDPALGLYLGVRRPQFPGTDALSMSVNPVAIGWLEDGHAAEYDLIVGEGARLGNRPFLSKLKKHADLLIIHLTGDPDVLYQRGLDRPDDGVWKPISRQRPDGTWERVQRNGRPQSPNYLKSRLGACRRLAEDFYPHVVTLNTTEMTPEDVEETLCMIL